MVESLYYKYWLNRPECTVSKTLECKFSSFKMTKQTIVKAVVHLIMIAAEGPI